MPEAAVHEHYLASCGEDQVWRTGQILSMKTEAIAESMDKPSHPELWPRIAASNAGHVRRPALWGDQVHCCGFQFALFKCRLSSVSSLVPPLRVGLFALRSSGST